ncbi:MAG: methylaspartate mutase [Candidatus Wallbacteria bacterium HGW-Wallbacteria-1]|jgi:uncharacterized protein (TIGR01319 family)|uniref:Methylaspartate mutase n=1 Tax=Candidatus Wallbacteria bacterium HGW-Wallbacteria-1 TaxID=2013854 RepID=A0A2N1PQ11_9BACT|nr:MAG: methylaspartate mutase [Candidatus Wallbacteria bacterium HGW-Wallbacteria-1]
MAIDCDKIKSIVATDCGSTTTKCILIEYDEDEKCFRQKIRGEAPTTVEKPAEDVTRGVLNAITEVQELVGRKLLDGETILKPWKDNQGVDIYISTSSAGGGLQMMVAGVVKNMTAESAARAALGAGAIVMDSIATNDGRKPFQQIDRIRSLRPDMILLSGGVDGGTTSHVVKLAEIIAAADPKPRLGQSYQLPVIYAGNIKARDVIEETLGEKTALDMVENLRPTLEQENLQPARHKIQGLFLEHVMAQAPGYSKLMEWADEEIMPTPGAVGDIMQMIAAKDNIQIVGVDIGGATTDVFSVFQGIYNRSVSANLGMSYSISNVVAEAGLKNVLRWVPTDMNERDLRNRVKNKMIRPTTIPALLEELIFEQAVAREALRLSFEQHKNLAVGLKGVQKQRTISDVFDQGGSSDSLVRLFDLDMLIGSGGVLSHAPRRAQTAMMLMDAFVPEGITMLTVDSIFMMPQLGVLAKVHPLAAEQVFRKDCIIYLGTCIAPVGQGKEGKTCMTLTVEFPGGRKEQYEVKYGEMRAIPLGVGEEAMCHIKPARGFDCGKGRNVDFEAKLAGGVVGLIVDGRGRPLVMPEDAETRIRKLTEWNEALGVYPRVK